MVITQGRNATLLIQYAGKKILIDPIFADKGTYPPFPSLLRSTEKNPLHDSPISISEMTKADAVIITHLHSDHFDEEAKQQLPKSVPIFVQNEADKGVLLSAAFQNVQVLGNDTMFETIRLIRTNGRHGYEDEIVKALGDVCGVIMQNEQEETVYLAGDTVWYDEVAKIITNELLKIYLTTRLQELERIVQRKADNGLIAETILRWTGSKRALVELIYALEANGDFNKGTATLKEIAGYFENVFSIDIGDLYHSYLEMRSRKINRTRYLETLQKSLLRRMDENDT